MAKKVITGCLYSLGSKDPVRISAAFHRGDFKNSNVIF
jgi:hypothetical protein